jgi:hypothetical protein
VRMRRSITLAQGSCLAALAVGIGALGCVLVGLVLNSSGWQLLPPASSTERTPVAAAPTSDLAPHEATLTYDPFAGSRARDRRSVWLLITADRRLTTAQALAIAQYYDEQHTDARFFDAIFLCEAKFATELALTTMTDDKFNPYVMYEYLHWHEDPKRPDPLFFTAQELTYGGTECIP